MTEQPPPPPTGWIALTLQGSVMTSNLIPPSVRLNGYPVTSSYGANLFPVPPGPWRVDVHCDWWRRYGEAGLDVQVAPGQTVPVFYAAPLHMFRGGRIGHERQKRQGALGLAVGLAIVIALVAVISVLAVI